MMNRLLIPLLITVIQLSAGATPLEATGMATLVFRYDEVSQRYDQTLDRAPEAGGLLRVVYEAARHQVLFRHQDRLFLRCSDDGWASCRDVEMLRDRKTGRYQGIVRLARRPGTLELAFFTWYENQLAWHLLWDSEYGRNFCITVIDPLELEKKDRLARLEDMDANSH